MDLTSLVWKMMLLILVVFTKNLEYTEFFYPFSRLILSFSYMWIFSQTYFSFMQVLSLFLFKYLSLHRKPTSSTIKTIRILLFMLNWWMIIALNDFQKNPKEYSLYLNCYFLRSVLLSKKYKMFHTWSIFFWLNTALKNSIRQNVTLKVKYWERSCFLNLLNRKK